MNANAYYQFAAWLQKNEPALFGELERRANMVPAEARALAGWTDIFSTVGSALGSAAKNVGSFLTSEAGMATVGGLATVYLASQSQKNAMNLQLAQVQAGQSPLPIQNTVTNGGQVSPYYYPPAGGMPQPLTTQLTNYLMPPQSFVKEYWPLLAGGGGLLLLFMLSSRK